VSLHLNSEPIEVALDQLARQGKFSFSYNSRLIDKGARISLSVDNELVKSVLDQMFSQQMDYKEANGYIILQRRLQRMSLKLEDIRDERRRITISGLVYDDESQQGVPNVSVYERSKQVATLTDQSGRFSLRIKGEEKSAILRFSKREYRDTSLFILSPVVVKPQSSSEEASKSGDGSPAVEESLWGKLLISSRQRMQSLNLGGLLTNSPVQLSITPGLSTQGLFSSQVVNKLSFNLLCGYTAGVTGVEVGGLFNINKSNVEGIQVGGLFNMVGGHVAGLQVGGLFNLTFNDVDGIQLAGIANVNTGSTNGLQVSGIANINGDKAEGIQVSLFNYSKSLSKVQIGIVNMADSSTGYSIGFVNIIRKNGYVQAQLSANEVFPLNVALKTGTPKLFCILHLRTDNTTAAYGFGFGHDFTLSRRWIVSTTLSNSNIGWIGSSSLSRLEANVQLKLWKRFSVATGPSLNLYHRHHQNSDLRIPSFLVRHATEKLSVWVGWQAGVCLF
jgi:hypothetical protein